ELSRPHRGARANPVRRKPRMRKRLLALSLLILAVLSVGFTYATPLTQQVGTGDNLTVQMAPGSGVLLVPEGCLFSNLADDTAGLHLNCSGPNATGTAQSTATPAASATVTPSSTPTRTATMTPTATHSATPTETSTATTTSSPTPTPTATAISTSQIPVAGQPCPSWVHDQYVTTGPDGKLYPTWHPPIDPQYGCSFGHEHGDDPRTSNANNTMPAFGYIGGLIGDNEPHTGFKVFVVNNGDPTNPNGTRPQGDYRVVFHQGTSGVARYSTEFHSMDYDYIARDGSGREAHVMGMVDTGLTSQDGSTCDSPRRGAKDFSTLGCDSAYEIWSQGLFKIVDPTGPGGMGVNQLQAVAGL